MRKSKYTKDYQKMYGEVLAYEILVHFMTLVQTVRLKQETANNKIRDIANKAKKRLQ